MKRSIVSASIAVGASAIGAFIPSDALATPTNLTIVNHTQITVACATVSFAEGVWTTHHWRVIKNGERDNVSGDAEFAYCEQLGGGRIWSDSPSSNFCVSDRGGYTNPIFRSDDAERCNRIGGIMRPFKILPGGSHTWFLE
ncbi:hypothetical protein [Sorangium sp. So ce1335]|uniref:hypothetical protein n=1 Tax=Sorangium sp. So ce1335 TaxID=3133335 RepID=UPI003F631C41